MEITSSGAKPIKLQACPWTVKQQEAVGGQGRVQNCDCQPSGLGTLSRSIFPSSVSGHLPSEVMGQPSAWSLELTAVLRQLCPAQLGRCLSPRRPPRLCPRHLLGSAFFGWHFRQSAVSVNPSDHDLFFLPGFVCCLHSWFSPYGPAVCSHAEKRRSLPRETLCFRCERIELSRRISPRSGVPNPRAVARAGQWPVRDRATQQEVSGK